MNFTGHHPCSRKGGNHFNSGPHLLLNPASPNPMSHAFNIYCDESCHLENDGHRAMVLGAIWCPSDKRRELAEAIRAIKIRHGLSGHHELKWTRVSPGKLGLYTDLIDLFFSSPDLRFRALVVPDKGKLDHARHGQTHDTFSTRCTSSC